MQSITDLAVDEICTRLHNNTLSAESKLAMQMLQLHESDHQTTRNQPTLICGTSSERLQRTNPKMENKQAVRPLSRIHSHRITGDGSRTGREWTSEYAIRPSLCDTADWTLESPSTPVIVTSFSPARPPAVCHHPRRLRHAASEATSACSTTVSSNRNRGLL